MRPQGHCPLVRRPHARMQHRDRVASVGENLHLEHVSDFHRVGQEGGTYHGHCVLAVEQNLLRDRTFPRDELAQQEGTLLGSSP